MNFLDPYDITNGSNATPQDQPEQTLNEEVSQVIGQLGRFWGGFKKQGQAAIDVARKDFTDVVTQAQKELTKLTTDAGSSPEQSGTQPEGSHPRASSETLKPTEAPTSIDDSSSTATTTQTLFSRLQSALPPNVVSTVQDNLPQSLRNISENTDFTQLRTTLSTEFQRLQGVTRAQAEEYVHKSEALLREAMKEAGEALKDAVKVLPPDEGAASGSGLIWDGSDMWMLPSDATETASNSGKGKASVNTQSAVATRAEALLRRLKRDPNILRHDPEADQGVQELFYKWLASEVDGKGGIESADWVSKIEGVLQESEDGPALQSTLDTLVPAAMPREIFWKRYFFRVYQIQTEEAKRKALLKDTAESEDDFSWEDDETEEDSTTTLPKKSGTSAPVSPQETAVKKDSAISPQATTPANTSPRESSEESYDLVSSENVGTSGQGRATEKGTAAESDDGDSDWE